MCYEKYIATGIAALHEQSERLYNIPIEAEYFMSSHLHFFQEADIGACTFSHTPERFQAFKFLTPIKYTKQSFIVHTQLDTSIYRFLTPLHVSTWITVFAALIIMSSITYGITNVLQKMHNSHKDTNHVLYHFQMMFQTLCQQGQYSHTWLDQPRSDSKRFLIFVSWSPGAPH